MPRLKWAILELRGEEDIVTSIKKGPIFVLELVICRVYLDVIWEPKSVFLKPKTLFHNNSL